MKLYIILLSCLLIISPVLGGNVLVLHMNYVSSYKAYLNNIVQTIAKEHTVNLYSVSHRDFPHPNVTVTYLDIPAFPTVFVGGLFESLCKEGPYSITTNTLVSPQEAFIESIYQEPSIQRLLQSNETYDVVMTYAAMTEFSLQFANVLKAPLVQMSATIPLVYNNEGLGNPPFLTTAFTFLAGMKHDSFSNRLIIYIRNLLFYMRYYMWYVPSVSSVTSKYLPAGTPSVTEANRNTSLLLANVHPAMGHVRPQMPNVVEIGGIHCRHAQPLPPDLEHFISGSDQHGIIYLSFGNSIRSKFPEHIKRTILATFQKLPQRIVWKWNDDVNDLPANVKASRWLPQQDILGHNKTRLFVTQGGMFSMQEAAFHGVPVLVIPIAFDQKTNAILAEELGYSKHIDFCEFSQDEFLRLIQELISNPTYKQNAERVSRLMRDEPMSAKDKLSWWINFIIRHKGNPNTQYLKHKYNGLVKTDVDIVAFLLLSTLLLVIIFYYSICGALRFMRTFSPKVKIKMS